MRQGWSLEGTSVGGCGCSRHSGHRAGRGQSLPSRGSKPATPPSGLLGSVTCWSNWGSPAPLLPASTSRWGHGLHQQQAEVQQRAAATSELHVPHPEAGSLWTPRSCGRLHTRMLRPAPISSGKQKAHTDAIGRVVGVPDMRGCPIHKPLGQKQRHAPEPTG